MYALNVYVRGQPTIVTIDDYLPFYEQLSLIFAKLGASGALLGPILEKAFAKTNGNYERINYGYAFEGIRYVSIAPYQPYFIPYLDRRTMWQAIQNAFINNFPMMVITDGSSDQYNN